jgi:hypothetical protein
MWYVMIEATGENGKLKSMYTFTEEPDPAKLAILRANTVSQYRVAYLAWNDDLYGKVVNSEQTVSYKA